MKIRLVLSGLSLWLSFLGLFLVSDLNGAVAEPSVKSETISHYVELATTSNPEIKASVARWQAFVNRIPQVGSLEDPMLTLGIRNGLIRDPLNFSRDVMTQKVVGISQQFPFWGKLPLRVEIARQEAEVSRWEIAERRLALSTMVKESWYRIFFVDRSLEALERNLKIMGDFVLSAETRYAVGQGMQQDIFRTQLERSMLLENAANLHQQRRSLEAVLNALLFRAAETPIGGIPDFPLTRPQNSAEELLALAEANRPILQGLQAGVAKGEAQRQLAQREYYPDLTAAFEYMQREPAMGEAGYDMYGVEVSFNLPVHRERRQAMVAEASAEINAARYELESLRNSLRSGIADTLAQLERTDSLVELYETGIIPQARQSLESALASYGVGKLDFETTLNSAAKLYDYERNYYGMLAEHQMSVARLEALVGVELGN